MKCCTSDVSSVPPPQDDAAPDLTSPDVPQHHSDMLELVHSNPLLYLGNYAPPASGPALALGCLRSSCRTLQGSTSKTHEALAGIWYYPETAGAILRKKNLRLCKHNKRRKRGHLLIMISTNKVQFCYPFCVNKFELFVIRDCYSEAVLILCYFLVPIPYSLMIVLPSIMKRTAQRWSAQSLFLFNYEIIFRNSLQFLTIITTEIFIFTALPPPFASIITKIKSKGFLSSYSKNIWN